MFFPGENRKIDMVGANPQAPNGSHQHHHHQHHAYGNRNSPEGRDTTTSPQSPSNPVHAFPVPRLTMNGSLSMNATQHSSAGIGRGGIAQDDPTRSGFMDYMENQNYNGQDIPPTVSSEDPNSTDPPPTQPTVIYQPVTPPSSIRMAAWRRYMYARDGFREPFDETTTSTDTDPAGMCMICYYSVMGSGEIMQTIMQIYNDNIGFVNVAQVYRIIMDYWNKCVAGGIIDIEEEEEDEDTCGNTDALDDSGSEAEEVNEEEEEEEEEEDDDESDDDDGDSDTSQAEECNDEDLSNTETPTSKLPPVSEPEHLIPRIKMAGIDYHFTHCYREQNGHRLIFDQMHKLIEIQDTIFQNGLFCKRLKVGTTEDPIAFALNTVEGGTSTLLSATPSPSEISLGKDILSELGNKIQEETIHITELQKQIRKMEASTGVHSKDTKQLMQFLKSSSDEKESHLKIAIRRFETMSKRLAMIDLGTSSPPSAQSGQPSGEEICVKMREAILVQSLGRSVISLLDKMGNYQRKRTHVPFGQTAEEYYRNVSFSNSLPTSNDQMVVKNRQRNFQSANTHLTPKLLNMTNELYKVNPHSSSTSSGTRFNPEGGDTDDGNTGEFKVGGTAVRNREFSSYRQSRRPDKPLRKRSRIEVE
jgi:hypothetical protein